MARVRELNDGGGDIFGFEREVLISSLDFAHAQEFLKLEDGAWCPELTQNDRLMAMKVYLAFAWGKARDHRGISASRSVTKLSTWAWILGNDELALAMQEGPYENYGCPALKMLADYYDLPVPKDQEIQNMIAGVACVPGCEEGCRR